MFSFSTVQLWNSKLSGSDHYKNIRDYFIQKLHFTLVELNFINITVYLTTELEENHHPWLPV